MLSVSIARNQPAVTKRPAGMPVTMMNDENTVKAALHRLRIGESVKVFKSSDGTLELRYKPDELKFYQYVLQFRLNHRRRFKTVGSVDERMIRALLAEYRIVK